MRERLTLLGRTQHHPSQMLVFLIPNAMILIWRYYDSGFMSKGTDRNREQERTSYVSKRKITRENNFDTNLGGGHMFYIWQILFLALSSGITLVSARELYMVLRIKPELAQNYMQGEHLKCPVPIPYCFSVPNIKNFNVYLCTGGREVDFV